MRDDGEGAALATRRLPPAALEGLRSAFAGEVAERLPRLAVVVARRDRSGLAAAVRDAHALGSSSAVLGEPVASARARAAERLLVELEDAADPGSWDAVRAEVDALLAALSGWLP